MMMRCLRYRTAKKEKLKGTIDMQNFQAGDKIVLKSEKKKVTKKSEK
mgnify:CR=1 FL=1